MKRALWKRLLGCLGAAGLVAAAIPIVVHNLGAAPPRQNGNTASSLEALVVKGPNGKGPAAPFTLRRADFSKMGIETPTEVLLAKSTTPAETTKAASTFANPRVQPGKVQWHATVEQACAASARSGKPVLIFSMMGRLDEKFC